jgi:hypothetical protein
MGTIGSGEFNNRRLLTFQPSFSFQGLSEREENPVLLGREYLNWLFAVQEFLFRQFIPSIHSVLIYDFNSSVFQQFHGAKVQNMEETSVSTTLPPIHLIPLSWPHIFPAKEWEIFLPLHESNFHFIREKPSFSQQCLCHLIQ